MGAPFSGAFSSKAACQYSAVEGSRIPPRARVRAGVNCFHIQPVVPEQPGIAGIPLGSLSHKRLIVNHLFPASPQNEPVVHVPGGQTLLFVVGTQGSFNGK